MNSSEPDAKFIIMGDFNLPSIEWLYDSNKCIAIASEGRLATEFLNTLTLTELLQVNSVKNNFNRILDLIVTNMEITKPKRTQGIVPEDPFHPALTFNVNIKDIKFMKSKKTSKLNYFKADYTSINRELDCINWQQEFENLNTNDATTKYYQLTMNIITKFTPKISTKSDNFPKWYSQRLIQLIREKEHYCNLKKRYKDNNLFKLLFSQKRKEIKREKKKNLFEYQSNIESLIKTNPKSFFSYTKSMRKSNKLPAVMRYKSQTAESMKDTANLFAKYFSGVYAQTHSTIDFECNNECNEYLQFTEPDILNIIIKLDKSKTNSPDGIPAIFYIQTANSISKALMFLFNKSLKEMVYPNEFKKSIVSPKFKAGDADNIENYRPISILSAISKIYDKLLYHHLSSKTSHLIVQNQHGFTAGKSTTTNLIEYTDYLSNNIAHGGQIDTAYMDLAKAFDLIDHSILLRKLSTLPISPCLIILLKSYLTNRKQTVCVYGEKSDAISPLSSVPQGSILSPLLFALFINDLPPLLSAEILLFADDLKLFLKICSLEDAQRLQKDIDTISNWCTINNLKLNINKCYIMSFSRRRETNLEYFNYNINGSPLMRINSIRDLGVVFNSKLSFENHVHNITSSAYKTLGFISRSLNKFKQIGTYMTLYNSYVRSILEYASSIWCPHSDNHITTIERVQKRFTRTIFRKFHYPYEKYHVRLIRLGMLSLENRRILNDELTLYKIKNGIIRIATEHDFAPIQSRFTRHNRIFYLPTVTTNIEFHSPLLRMHRRHMECFNTLNLYEPTFSAFRRYALHETHLLNVI